MLISQCRTDFRFKKPDTLKVSSKKYPFTSKKQLCYVNTITAMAIADDWNIDYTSKTIRHISGTTVYSAVEFYSYLMDTFDEPGNLTYEIPIKSTSPTSFTMLNGWSLDNSDKSNSLEYISGTINESSENEDFQFTH